MSRTGIALAVFLFFGLIALYVFEFRQLSNIFNASQFIVRCLLLGASIGFITAYYRNQHTVNVIHGFQNYAALVVLGLFFAPLVGSLSNRFCTPHAVRQESVIFIKETPYFSNRFGIVSGQNPQPDGYFLYFEREKQIERIKTKQAHFHGVKGGEQVLLPIQKGLWGYDFIAF